MDTVVLTDLIAEFHQLLDAFLVGMILLPILEADRIDYQMRMNMLSVNVSCDYTLILPEGFFCKLHCNFVRKFRLNIIPTRKALHQMIVQSTVRLVIQVLGRGHFVESSLGRAVHSGHETLVLRHCLFLSADIIENVLHATSSLSLVVYEMDDRHYLTSFDMSQTA